MVCLDCDKCRGAKDKNGVYVINCSENGEFQLHSDYEDNFTCEEYTEAVREEPVKDNIHIILNCGRDITVYDKDITCSDDMERRLGKEDGFVQFDGLLIRKDEIAVMRYIDED